MIKQINRHRISDFDIMENDLSELIDGETIDIFYSDPPWGVGNLKYWQTIRYKQCGIERKQVNLEAFINKIFFMIDKYLDENGIAFIEYGVRWKEFMRNKIKKNNLKLIYIVPTKYKSGGKKRPLNVFVFTKGKKFNPNIFYNANNTFGYNTLLKLFENIETENKKILDPCCGCGLTAKLAKANNMIFYGNEFNPKRLKKTERKLL